MSEVRISDATYWLLICGTRVFAGQPSLVDDPWCRRTLERAACDTLPCGLNGRLWMFPDGSRLFANRLEVRVLMEVGS